MNIAVEIRDRCGVWTMSHIAISNETSSNNNKPQINGKWNDYFLHL